jgi:protocatechuate 3,4-dioxygenase beta subunit
VKVLALILLCATLSADLASAQSTGSAQWYDSRRGTAAITGYVSTVDGRPASGADVLLSAPVGKRRILADQQGWFEFRDLMPGEYHVSATMAGYLTRAHGQTLDDGRPASIQIRNGQVKSDIDIVLPKSGVVIVQVTDEFNAPIEGASVRLNHASQIYRENGQWRSFSPTTKQRTETTDDRGEIRVIDLRAGEYFVAVALPGVSRNTFYPGVARFDDAVPVTLALGEELTVGVSVVRPRNVKALSRTGVIAVHVTDESGSPLEGVEVRALAVTGEGQSRSTSRAPLTLTGRPDSSGHKEFYTDDNGDVRIYGLRDGEYVVVAQPVLSHVVGAKPIGRELVVPPIYYPGSSLAAGAQPISISSWSEVNLDLRIAPVLASRITGRVVRADGEASQSRVILRWNPESPLYSESISTADVRVELVDGMFVFPAVHPGDYIIETDDGDLSEREGRASVTITVVQGEDLSDLLLTIVSEHRAPR